MLGAIRRSASEGSIIGLHLDRGVDYLALLVAIVRSHGTAVPLPVEQPLERLFLSAKQAGVDTVVTVDSEPWAGTGVSVIDVAELAGTASQVSAARPRHPLDTPVVLFTSGTTGKPLAVETTWAALDHRLAWDVGSVPNADQRVLGKTSIGFVDSLTELLAPLGREARVAMIDAERSRDPVKLAATAASEAITDLTAVPTLWSLLVEHIDPRTSCLSRLISSGEPLTDMLAEQMCALLPGAAIFDLFGASETGGDNLVAPIRIGAGQHRSGVFRSAVPGTSARVVTGPDIASPRALAELALAGPMLANGYRGSPKATADRFRPDPSGRGTRWFRTGDLGWGTSDGTVILSGRAVSQINVRGRRVDPEEVEGHLARHEGIRAALVGLVDGAFGPELIAAVEARGPHELEIDDVRIGLGRRLPREAIPQRYFLVDRVPTSTSGKRWRQGIEDLVRSGRQLVSRRGGPFRTEWERLVGGEFEEVLGHSGLGRLADFFDLGGHSVLAAELVSLLSRRSGRLVALSDLLSTPVVADLAAVLADRPLSDSYASDVCRTRRSRRQSLSR